LEKIEKTKIKISKRTRSRFTLRDKLSFVRASSVPLQRLREVRHRVFRYLIEPQSRVRVRAERRHSVRPCASFSAASLQFNCIFSFSFFLYCLYIRVRFFDFDFDPSGVFLDV